MARVALEEEARPGKLMDGALSRSLLLSIPSAVCVADDEGKIVDGNPGLEELLGWSLDAQRGRLLADCLGGAIADPPQALSWLVALNEALVNERTTYLNLPTDFRTGFADRRLATLVGVAAPWRDDAGQQVGALLLLHDGALYRDIEGVRARFLAAISHELNSPVNNLVAAVEQMARHLEPDDAAVGRLLGILQAELARLQRLLGSLLSSPVARATASVVSPDLVALKPLIRRAASVFAVHDTGHDIVLDLPSDLPFALGDADSIQQVLGNLVDNALQSAPAGSPVTLLAEARDEDVLVRVQDRGPGIVGPSSDCLLLRRVDLSQATAAVAGHGIGLTIAACLLEAMDGRLWHQECPTGGGCFCFSLPRAPVPAGEGGG
jgi:signal transduction histidine kinase